MRVLLLADTHGVLDARIAELARQSDLVVHAGTEALYPAQPWFRWRPDDRATAGFPRLAPSMNGPFWTSLALGYTSPLSTPQSRGPAPDSLSTPETQA